MGLTLKLLMARGGLLPCPLPALTAAGQLPWVGVGAVSGLCIFMDSLELHRLLTQPPEPAHTHQPAPRGQEGSRTLTFEPLPWRLSSGPVVGTQGARCYSLILKGMINSQMPGGFWLRPLCAPCTCIHCHLLPRPSCLSLWLHSMPHRAPVTWSLPFPPYHRGKFPFVYWPIKFCIFFLLIWSSLHPLEAKYLLESKVVLCDRIIIRATYIIVNFLVANVSFYLFLSC